MKILMADDDDDDRSLSKMAIDRLKRDIQVEFTASGEELIRSLTSKINNHKPLPDLVMLDLNMPGKNGLDALKEIKSHPELKQLSVIIFTTSKSEQDRKESLNRGANGFVVKPSEFSKLVDTFRRICENDIPPE